ncbi:MAG: hypothetical protein HY556_00215 [Euryarchaeota archaeon]|nr:hypothetical protein [Euryarchaeota archaeon]
MRNLQVAFLLAIVALAALLGSNVGRREEIVDLASLQSRVGEDVSVRGHVVDARVGRTGHTMLSIADTAGGTAKLSFPAIVPVLEDELIEARGRVATGLDGVVVFANVDSLRTIKVRSLLTVAELNAQAPRILGRTVTVVGVMAQDGEGIEDLDGGHRICVRITSELAFSGAMRFTGVTEYRPATAQYCLKVKAAEGFWPNASTKDSDDRGTPAGSDD